MAMKISRCCGIRGKKIEGKIFPCFNFNIIEATELADNIKRATEVTFYAYESSRHDSIHTLQTWFTTGYQCPGAFYYFRSTRRNTASMLHIFPRKDSSSSDFGDEQVRRHKIIAHQRG